VTVTLEKNDEMSTIRLEGAIEIASAGELKALLIEALESGRAVRVAVEETADLDVTAMQLLYATRRAAKASGVTFEFQGQAPKRILAALAHAGLEKFVTDVEANQLAE
jgi:anti-anti-sigma regulatory factor